MVRLLRSCVVVCMFAGWLACLVALAWFLVCLLNRCCVSLRVCVCVHLSMSAFVCVCACLFVYLFMCVCLFVSLFVCLIALFACVID